MLFVFVLVGSRVFGNKVDDWLEGDNWTLSTVYHASLLQDHICNLNVLTNMLQ